MLLHSVQVAELERIRETLEEYQRLPFMRRLGSLLLGHYPLSNYQEMLRRCEIGPTKRIEENIRQAVRVARKINNPFLAYFDTGDRLDKSIRASVMLNVGVAAPNGEYNRLFDALQLNRLNDPELGLGAGVFVHRRKDTEIVDEIGGIYTVMGGTTISEAALTPALLSSLSPELMSTLEQFTETVARVHL